MFLVRRFQLSSWLQLMLVVCAASARAEGSAQLEAPVVLLKSTTLYVDILDSRQEALGFVGDGSLTVFAPGDDLNGSLLESGKQLMLSHNGPHRIELSADQQSAWHIDVVGAAPGRGRLYARRWEFDALRFDQSATLNGSFYAVAKGLDGHDSVVELQLQGTAGYRFNVGANASGVAGPSAGRSVRAQDNSFEAELPLYLLAPESAQYSVVVPHIESKAASAGRLGCDLIIPGKTQATVQFTSDLAGRYELRCDVDRDGQLTSAEDLVRSGTVAVGNNQLTWDGRGLGQRELQPGDYDCVLSAEVGEAHFILDDAESCYPGLRMFLLDSALARRPLSMRWDDSALQLDQDVLPDGQRGLVSSLGLESGAYSAPAVANENARAWGNPTGASRGDDALVDTYSKLRISEPRSVHVEITTEDADADADMLPDYLERCELGTDPRARDSDHDGVSDSAESPGGKPIDTDGDGKPDALDPDSDGDGAPDATDRERTDPRSCADADADGCDDCSVTAASGGGPDPHNDGKDSDGDGACDAGDEDDDDDGVPDAEDGAALDPWRCRDSDADGCDDCSQSGPNKSGGAPEADGDDPDADGRCGVAPTPELPQMASDAAASPEPVRLRASGGAFCSTLQRDSRATHTLLTFACAALLLGIRRRWLRRAPERSPRVEA